MASSATAQSEALARYAPREVRFEGLERAGSFVLKRYHIRRSSRAASVELVDAARACVAAHLATQPPAHRAPADAWWSLPTHGLGSLIVHEGADANFVLLDHWVDSSMLRHHVWASPFSAPSALTSMRDTDLAMCVWELAVIQHERAAWLRHMFRSDGVADVNAYLEDTLSACI